ncbi:flagellar protein [Leptospira congkakensis]|uniref:Flagellar protein n=1 Tax=Leptospira congkakensis TaxID=2484932 RepID=A0A4Z1A630_9LEPT|nr:flagellar FlbD family protein [Leptospira congkakensis]TGL86419.1 flagellar protein [Leptospira congkakensis]TGL94035.1 flagellar protein [Leptospira congkakensis]TGL94560.1 flagellar protein [Leptospira congkakensis]
MVILHRLKGAEFVLNADLIETIEANPDTIITLVNEKKFIVQEAVSEVLEKVVTYQTRIHGLPRVQQSRPEET